MGEVYTHVMFSTYISGEPNIWFPPYRNIISGHILQVHSRFHDLTGLGFLDFWMQSIYAYATTNLPTSGGEDRPQLSPPIFIVGTHRDSEDISADADERKTKVKKNIINTIQCHVIQCKGLVWC